jgi:hypothetical protein
MGWVDTAKRWLKLGFFIGAGAMSAAVSACSSTVARIDTGKGGDTAAPDQGTLDQRAPDADSGIDAAAQDSAALDAGAPDKKRGWDIPLE